MRVPSSAQLTQLSYLLCIVLFMICCGYVIVTQLNISKADSVFRRKQYDNVLTIIENSHLLYQNTERLGKCRIYPTAFNVCR